MSDPLDDFFKQEETTLIFDLSNMAYRALHAVIYATPTDNGKFELWKHTFINSLFSVIGKFEPNKVIFAGDGKGNWRYDVYKEYKCKRHIDRAKSPIQFDKFFVVFDELLTDIQRTFTNIVLIKEEKTEADDVISILSREIKNDNIIIVSSDRDLNQLLTPKVRQYKPITETFVESINPYKDLQIKILAGDSGDSIPPIRPKCGPKTSAKILESGLEEYLATDQILKSNWERNKQLIDLKCIPSEIVTIVINKFKNYDISPIDPSIIFKFFTKHRLQKLISNWNIIGEKIKKLHNNGTISK